jgi:hypothetical protein
MLGALKVERQVVMMAALKV